MTLRNKAIWLAALSFFLVKSAYAEALVFSRLDGKTGKITATELKANPLILFWRSDCAPCLIEMGFLPEIAANNPDLKIAVVALQDKETVQKHIPRNLPANVGVIIAESDGRDVLKSFGDDKASLPFSVMMHKDGSICDRNDGILGIKKVNHWVKTC